MTNRAHSYWEVSADRLQKVMEAVPGLEDEARDQMQARLAEAAQSGNEELRPLFEHFAEMQSLMFADILMTWRNKYRR